jgi:maleamate amidohydrolase
MPHSEEEARFLLQDAFSSVEEDYRARGIFQDRFGYGRSPALVVVDFAYGWTDEAYAGGSRRLDSAVEATRSLLDAARARALPVVYTTSPWRPDSGDQPFKSAADRSPGFRAWDERACRIDERVAPHPGDLVLEKENASAFFGTHLAPYLIGHGVDTLLIAGCSTSACIRATATDAKSYRFRPIIVRECVGDRSPVAHEWTLFDIQARFADVVPLDEALAYVSNLDARWTTTNSRLPGERLGPSTLADGTIAP